MPHYTINNDQLQLIHRLFLIPHSKLFTFILRNEKTDEVKTSSALFPWVNPPFWRSLPSNRISSKKAHQYVTSKSYECKNSKRWKPAQQGPFCRRCQRKLALQQPKCRLPKGSHHSLHFQAPPAVQHSRQPISWQRPAQARLIPNLDRQWKLQTQRKKPHERLDETGEKVWIVWKCDKLHNFHWEHL